MTLDGAEQLNRGALIVLVGILVWMMVALQMSGVGRRISPVLQKKTLCCSDVGDYTPPCLYTPRNPLFKKTKVAPFYT